MKNILNNLGFNSDEICWMCGEKINILNIMEYM